LINFLEERQRHQAAGAVLGLSAEKTGSLRCEQIPQKSVADAKERLELQMVSY